MSDPRTACPQPEATRRGLVPAESVVLADGLAWGLAGPTPRYQPEFGKTTDTRGQPEAAVRVTARLGYPWEIERLVDRLGAACQSGTTLAHDRERFDALMTLASALLRRAHDLDRREAEVLLDLDPAGLIRLVDAVLRIINRPLDSPPSGAADAP